MKIPKIILIGKSTAGKSTLCQKLHQQALIYKKTQTVEIINGRMIDTPGEYLELRKFRGALTVASTDADMIVLVQDATENGTMFPPSYISSFNKPAIGLVTKADLADKTQIASAIRSLNLAGVSKVFVISSVTGLGMKELEAFLNLTDKSNGFSEIEQVKI